jgi:hypothetical protein
MPDENRFVVGGGEDPAALRERLRRILSLELEPPELLEIPWQWETELAGWKLRRAQPAGPRDEDVRVQGSFLRSSLSTARVVDVPNVGVEAHPSRPLGNLESGPQSTLARWGRLKRPARTHRLKYAARPSASRAPRHQDREEDQR